MDDRSSDPAVAFEGRSCLVTGGLGFIGSNLALALAGAGARVTVVDAAFARHGADRRNLDGAGGPIRVIAAEIGDADAVRGAVGETEFVFNLAGQVSHVDSMTNPLFDLDVNLRSQLAFLEVIREVNPDAVVVYTSTRQVFGRPHYLPVDEEHPVDPVDVNGVMKHAAEELHLMYGAQYGLRSSSLRLTNIYGPRQRLDGDLQGFLPIFIRRALDDEELVVYGDGAQVRDCLYVDDVVESLLLAAASIDAPGEVFNIGGVERLSVREIAEMIVAATGSGIVISKPWPSDRDAIDIGSYATDGSKAKRLLGWEPETFFAEGIERTVAFHRDRRDASR